MKNNGILKILVAVLVVGISLETVFLLKKDNKIEKSVPKSYRLTIQEDSIPGGKYDIDLDKEDNITVTKTRFCSALDCGETTPKVTNIHLTGENKKYAVNFIKSFFSKTENTQFEISQRDLTEIQSQTIALLLENRDDLFSLVSEPYEYLIIYEDGNSGIYVYQNKKNLKVKKVNYNEDFDVIAVDSYDITFAEENKKFIEDYFAEIFKNSKENYHIIESRNSNKKVQAIMDSLSHNDEKYLEGFEKLPKLVFEIHNLNLKCPIVSLNIYDDHTYEFYHTYQNGKPVDIRVGTYTEDATSILKNIDTFSKEGEITYSLKDSNGKEYTVSNNNPELEDFLKTIPENLMVCATYKD